MTVDNFTMDPTGSDTSNPTGETTGPDLTTTIGPTVNGTTEASGKLTWLPYAILGTALVAFFILLLFCFCKSLRDCFLSCCFVRKKNHLIAPSHAPPDSKFTSGYQASSSNIASSTSKSPNRSNSSMSSSKKDSSLSRSNPESGIRVSKQISNSRNVSTHPPAIKPSSMVPTRSQLVSGAKTQKYIGTILSTKRKSGNQPARATPSRAPSAAVQVARTQKIIGNILTRDGTTKRRK